MIFIYLFSENSISGISSCYHIRRKEIVDESDSRSVGTVEMSSENLGSILRSSSMEVQRHNTFCNVEEPLHIADVADQLHNQYAIISGGRSLDTGSPLITFPDHNNFQLLSDDDYQKLIQYLIGVTSLQDADLGFQIIVDRRKNTWASVKSVLLKISVSLKASDSLKHQLIIISFSHFFQA